MDSKRRQSARPPARPVQAEAVVPEKDRVRHDKSVPADGVSPHSGRTGGLGARAERPSEGTARSPDSKVAPRRDTKAPAPRAARRSGR
jgi:hypothetical protein